MTQDDVARILSAINAERIRVANDEKLDNFLGEGIVIGLDKAERIVLAMSVT